jgi:hypothetical protein
MQEYLDLAMEQNNLQKPDHWQSSTELYLRLKEIAQLWIDCRFIVNGHKVSEFDTQFQFSKVAIKQIRMLIVLDPLFFMLTEKKNHIKLVSGI